MLLSCSHMQYQCRLIRLRGGRIKQCSRVCRFVHNIRIWINLQPLNGQSCLQQINMLNHFVHEMKGNQFPFGLLESTCIEPKKILIKKRYLYKNHTEHGKLKDKIEKLKTIAHRNTINLRSAEDQGNGYIDLFYPYVPVPLEDSFNQNPEQTVKELHKQFIELAIYLAKNYILTSFNPGRCGVIFNENRSLVKYYLPLNEIIITSEVGMLQRSVQLFSVQSMHYLDTLAQSAMNTTMENSSQCSFKNRMKLFPEMRRNRKESQPVKLLFNNFRKFSTNPVINPQLRKLSNLSKELSEFSEMRKKRTKQSTSISTGSFSTFKNLLSQPSERDVMLRSYVSESKTIKERVLKIKERSVAAIKGFKELKSLINQHRSVSVLMRQIKE